MNTKPIIASAKKKAASRATPSQHPPPSLPEATLPAAKTPVTPPKAKRAAKPKTAAVPRKKVEVPPLLLEGDQPAPPPASGPGKKYALGPVPPAPHFEAVEAALPEAYGTRRLFLTARDPHWLYAHWDLTREQQLKLNARSADGHLVLRVYAGKIEGHPLYEIHVHPES